MTTNVRKQKIITAIFWSVMAVMLLAMGIYAIRDLPMRLAMKVSPSIHLAIEMSTDNSTYKTVFKNYGNETLDSNINRTIEDGNKITLTGDIFDNIYSNEPLYIRITNYTQASDVEGDANYSSGPALNAYFSAENGVTNYPSYGVENIAPYNGTTLYSKTFIVIPQSVIVDSSYEFNLKLELSNFVETEYTVTQTLATGITSLNNFATTKAILGHDFEVNFVPNDDENNVAITSITFGATQLTELSDYTFNGETNTLKVNKEVFEDNAGNPLATTNQLTINTAVKPANVNVYFFDECQNATLLKYQSHEYSTGDCFEISTGEKFIATMLKIDDVANLWVSIGGVYTENYNYNRTTGLLTISQNAIAGDIRINMYSYWIGNVASSFAGGNGTSANPYKICSPSQLAYLAQTTNAGTSYSGLYLEVKNDLYLNDELFTWNTETGYVTANDSIHSARIGTGIPTTLGATNATIMGQFYDTYQGTLYQWTPIGNFRGNFNGNNFVINNCYLKNTTQAYIGLFSTIYAAKVENIIIKNSLIFGYGTSSNLIAYAASNSTINNCSVNDSYLCSIREATYAESNSGAVCGYLWPISTLKNCSAFNVYNYSNGKFAGGLIGHVWGSANIYNSYVVNSTVISDGSYGYGGLIGLVNDQTNHINNCYAYDIKIFVTASNGYAEFFGKLNRYSHYAESCYYEGTVINGSGGGGTLTATNCSQINGNTLVTETYGTNVLKDALNNWLSTTNATDATKTNRQYYDIGNGTWQVTAGVNGGYPYFQ